jgi:signal transduction histidine kinase/GAF domain-containing protein
MSFTQQFVQLLSQLPGSIVYHVITLLAVEATLGLALWQRQRNPRDELATRLMWASVGILAGRLIVIFAILLLSDPAEALTTLPPLERAVDALTAALLVWALSPHPRNLPRLGDILLLITLIVIGFTYAVLAQEWMQQYDDAFPSGGYTVSSQAAIWEVFQLALLALGGTLILLKRQEQWHLRLAIIGALFLAHVLNLFAGAELLSPENNIAYWVRLGNLIAFPLLAALAYRHNLSQLLPDVDSGEPAPNHMAEHLQVAGRVIAAKNSEVTVQEALAAADNLIGAELTGLAMIGADSREQLTVTVSTKQNAVPTNNGKNDKPGQRSLQLGDWPALRLSLHQLQSVELVPRGLGARQLNQLYHELEVGTLGALLIEPLVAGGRELGLLLLAGPPGMERWPSDQKRLTRAVADFLAVAIADSRLKENARSDAANLELGVSAKYAERLSELERERDQALSNMASTAHRQRLAEEHLASETKKVSELTAALIAAKIAVDDGKVKAMEDEVASLRESLSAAEEALSLGGHDGTNLSPDWVTRTVTRYSGDLEDANKRINQLETLLIQANDSRAFELIADHVRQLRTPLTSLAGYTDLLLGESLGFLGSKQMSLLRRMKLNIETVARSLDRITAVARQGNNQLLDKATTDSREAIESAARAMETQFRARRLSLDLALEDHLPPVPSHNDAFFRIVVLLLRNACQVSDPGSHLAMSARVICLEEARLDDQDSMAAFLHLTVTDAGGRQTWDLHSRSLESLQLDRGETAERGGGLDSVAEAVLLASRHGGRTWVDQTPANGCAFSVLLPINDEDPSSENCA